MVEDKIKISLVEDNEEHVFFIKKALSEFKSIFDIESFSSGHDLFNHLDKDEDTLGYDAMIVDYTLPKMNGIQVLKKLHSRGYNIPTIFVTNREDERLAHDALSLGADDYLLKKEGYLSILPLVLLKAVEKYRYQKQRTKFLESIKKLKEYFEKVINTIPFTVIGLNYKREVSYANSECKKLFFMDPCEIIGNNIIDLFEPSFLQETRLVDHIDKLLDNNQPITLRKVDFLNSRREKKILEIQLFRISTETGQEILLFINDITRNIELEQKLFQAEKLSSFGNLLTGLTHELNNRVSPILAYSQLLISTTNNDKDLERLRNIEQSAESIKSLVESLLYFSPDKGQQNLENISLKELSDNVLSLLRYKFNTKNISISSHFKENTPDINGDKKQLSRVLLNILNNSYEAMEQNGGNLSISSGFDNRTCQIIIEDTGTGISTDNLPKILDPFFTTKTDKNNVGLGLSIAYNLLQNHQGSIDISSEERSGTTVTITLPITLDTPVYDVPIKKDTQHKTATILIIDDDEILRDVMKDILEELYHVETAVNGNQAIDKITLKDYSVILTDLRMPGIDGQKLYKWIKENRPGLETKVVFTTGDTYDPEINSFIKSTGNNIITKPFYIDDLKNVIESVL